LSGYTAINDGNGTNDCNGHGTHVAGTVGGSTYGVAKNVTLYAVRVLGCNGSGSNSGVIAGVNWVTSNRVLPAVANMSLGGGASSALDTAVNNSINAGVTYAIAAGNSNANACSYSPARVAAAITVGSTTNTDARSSFSNFGTCLDLFAPGSGITSAWHTNDTATNTISGTSMATPHVAGVAALYLQTNPGASAATVRNALVGNATSGKVTGPGSGSPNLLLYSIFGAPAPTNTPTSAPNPTNTPTSVPNPTNTPTPPPGGTNVLQNPGFESGPNVAWTDTSSGGYEIIDTTRRRTGAYSAYFCDYNNCTDTLEQQVTVPANGTLTYYWYQTSSEGTGTAYDYLHVRVYSTGGALLATLRSWSNRNTRGAWSLDTLSMAAYAGQTVRLRFVSTTDSSLRTAFFVDDVALK
jgi:subtilisin family serine protease